MPHTPGTLGALPHFAGSQGFPLPAPLEALFADGRLLAVSFSMEVDTHGIGTWTDQIAVCVADPLGGLPQWLADWSHMAAFGIPGLAEALLSVSLPRPVAASVLSRLWKQAKLPMRRDQEDTTELSLALLPSGMVLALHDPLDHFGTYTDSFRPEDMAPIREIDRAFAQGQDAFRTVVALSHDAPLWPGLGAWLVPAPLGDQPPSAHTLVPLMAQGAQVAREWARIQPLEPSWRWLADLDWRGPTGEAIAQALTRG